MILSATAAAWFPQAALAVTNVKVSGTAKVKITNIPSVNLNGTPTVRLETGSTVALQPGSAVSLQPGTTVGLQPGAAVSLQPGSTVGLTPGSTVSASLPAGTKVGLEAGTTVKVDPTSTVSVRDDAAREAVQMEFNQLSMGANQTAAIQSFAVPDGRILVLEYLSCSVQLPTNQDLYADLDTTVGGAGALHSFFPAGTFADGSLSVKRVIISSSTRLYADPGTTVTFTVIRTISGGISVAPFICSLSGYYVDNT